MFDLRGPALMAVFLVLGWGCSAGPCEGDADCKGDRVCTAGVCVDPEGQATGEGEGELVGEGEGEPGGEGEGEGECSDCICIAGGEPCAVGDACTAGGACVVDDRGPFCRACAGGVLTEDCGDPRNYCLPQGPDDVEGCGVSCSAGETCPFGFTCELIFLETPCESDSDCPAIRCLQDPRVDELRCEITGQRCNVDAECGPPPASGRLLCAEGRCLIGSNCLRADGEVCVDRSGP